MNIILWGFMGAGKSTIGKRVAEKFNFELLDSDLEIEKKAEMSILDLFQKHGELHFRQLENQYLTDLLEQNRRGEFSRPIMLTTGGGMPISMDNQRILKELGRNLFIHVPFAEIVRRLQADTQRPLWNQNELELMEQRYNNRLPAYLKADYVIEAGDLTLEEMEVVMKEKLNLRAF